MSEQRSEGVVDMGAGLRAPNNRLQRTALRAAATPER